MIPLGFTALDTAIVLLYLVGMAIFGVLSGGRQTSARDYFLGSGTIPWWAACFAIVATETSTLTFISIPALAYAGNLNFLQVTVGYLLGRIVVAWLLLPAYAQGQLATAYQYLGGRFGPRLRSVASLTFMGTRVLADGVRLFATAIPLALLLKGWGSLPGVSDHTITLIAILVMAGITLVYTFLGGVRAVIWTDVVQMFIYLGGAVGALLVIFNRLPPGALSALPIEKFSVLNAGGGTAPLFTSPYTLAASLAGGAFLSMASHGTDQIIVQRLLTVTSLSGSRKALVGSGVVVILQFALFLVIGVLLYAFYGGASLTALGLTKGDEIFPKFILEMMPSGLSGLIIAGLLAAAMSTLSGSINSLASTTIHDFYKPYFDRGLGEKRELLLSRLVSLAWCAVLVAVAFFFIATTSKVLVELALSIASVTYGGLLGAFLLGVLFPRVRERDAITGFAAGIATMAVVVFVTPIAWTWFTIIGTLTTVAVGTLTRTLFPPTA